MATSLNQQLREGITAAKAGAFDTARPLLEEVTRSAPDQLLAWFWLAAASPSADAAIRCLRVVLKLDPAHELARQGLAKLLVSEAAALAASGQRDAARALAVESCEMTPASSSVWLGLAALVDGDERVAVLRRAAAANDQDPHLRTRLRQALLYRANMLARSDRAAARALFLEALEFDRKDSRIWMALAHLAETPGQSVATLRELLTLEPAHAAGRSLLKGALVADARALHARGGAAAAVERLKESLAIDDRNIDAWLCLSEVSADGDESARALDMAAAIDSADVRVLAAVARMREQLDAVADVSAASFDRLAAPASLDGLDNLDGDDGFAQFDIVEASAAPPEPAPAAEPVAALTPPPAPAEPPAARTILIVDDSPTIRKILALTLERAGYTVVAEPDGEAALKRLEEIVPSLIFLDIAMPNLDGYEVCKQIRKGARTAAIPVVMLSGKDAFFDKVKGKMAGATEYLTKPFETPVVLSVAATHCQPAEEVVHG